MMDRKSIESDVRYRIDSLLGEAEIVIAFPQRDVHLDSVRPIDIRMVPAESVQESAAAFRREGQ